MAKKASRANRNRRLPKEVFKKAAHLEKEGKSRDQAIGEAAGMWKEGRLKKSGEYVRAKK